MPSNYRLSKSAIGMFFIGGFLPGAYVYARTPAFISLTPATGAVGISVSISDLGFDTTLSANTVKFDGVMATVTATTENSIGACVPSYTTTGSVTVTTSGQTSTSSVNCTLGNDIN